MCFEKLEIFMKFKTISKDSCDVLEKIKIEYENNKDLDESDDHNYENNIYVSNCDIKYSSDDENTIKLFEKVEPEEKPRKCKKKRPDCDKITEEKKIYNRTRMCQICGTMQKGLKAHMATHSGERAFECMYKFLFQLIFFLF